MGICASCLGGNRHESPEPESSRLLDEDPYQAGYGYGALNQAQQANQPDPEVSRVLDLDPHDFLVVVFSLTFRPISFSSVIDIWSLQPQPHLQPHATLHVPRSTSTSPTTNDGSTHLVVTSDQASTTSRPNSGGAVPKHWGEVVVNPNKKRSRPNMKIESDAGRDVFGVLKVT
ncbi:hypothetical protein N7520_008412 [Penicillium odoratum]|uniref:uncharacterized protein n=1 Tax=Penicillium odoratum TaxID=1167516 RepID=UPI0025490ADF|nr:uncharacterized protein N7520_008412 [Penicillium odoratum]KAJ5761256.1 hypothetical protein N7520_008412 [Penicillium odoratum]